MAENKQPTESNDVRIRQRVKQQDYEYIARMKQEMQAEQAQLRAYFDQSKRKTSEDPSIRRKERYQEKMGVLSETLKNIKIFNLYDGFWNFKPQTPEETETLNLCKRHIKNNLLWSSALGLSVTSFTSYSLRVYLGFPMIAFGVFVGVVGGGMFGLLRSTEFVLKTLSDLGPDYALGRMVTQDIEEFRLDKKKQGGSSI